MLPAASLAAVEGMSFSTPMSLLRRVTSNAADSIFELITIWLAA
jgi:hypothetical protein